MIFCYLVFVYSVKEEEMLELLLNGLKKKVTNLVQIRVFGMHGI